MDALVGISTQHAKLFDHDRLDKTEVLAEIVAKVQGPTPQVIDTAKSIVKDHNAETDHLQAEQAEQDGSPPPEKKSKVHTSSESDAQGFVRRTWIGTEDKARAWEAALGPAARDLMRKNPDLDYAEALALIEEHRALHPGQPDPNSPDDIDSRKAPLVAAVIITEDDEHDILQGKVNKKIFGMTDGGTITQREVVARGLADKRYYHTVTKEGETLEVEETHPEKLPDDLTGHEREAALAKTRRPVPGRLNTGTTRRGMNRKQRLAAEAMNLVCAWPDCSKGAIHCDGHHIQAWAHGGPTDMKNLTLLCKHHNGLNDDDRTPPRNGHVFMREWQIYYQPPRPDEPPVAPRGPLLNLTSVAIGQGRFGSADQPEPPQRKLLQMPDDVPGLDELPKEENTFPESEGPPPF